jgi:O-antigen/teichoic acid export membrane protein
MTDPHHSRLRWSLLSTFSTAAMQLVASVTITRFLQPADYGLAAMAMLCYSMTGYLTQLGMGRAVVQKPGLTEGNIRAAFSLALLTGVGGFVILAALSPLLGQYFREPRLPIIIIAFGLNLIFQSASMVTGGLLRREFRIRDLAICDFLGYLLSTFGIGLPMAIKGFGVWALVGSNVSQPLIVAIAYFIARPHSLAPTFAREDYSHITGFSGKATLTTAVEAAGGSLDTIVMGRIVSPAALGLYNRSQTLSMMPGYNISMGLTRVFYPTLARAAEHSLKDCHEILVKTERQLMSLIFPFCAGAAIAAPTIIPTIFGRQWTSAVPVYQVLCLAAALDASFHLPSIQLEVLSQFRQKLILQVIFAVCFGAGILLVAPRGGVVAVAFVLALLQAMRTFALHRLSARSLGVSIFSILRSWIPGLVCAAAVGALLDPVQNRLSGFAGLPAVLRLIALILLSAATFFAVYRAFYRDSVYRPWLNLFKKQAL